MNGNFLEEGHDENPEPPGCCFKNDPVSQCWWERSDFGYRSDILFFGDTALCEFSDRIGDLPAYIYRPQRAAEKAAMIRSALPELGKLLYAIKANRHPGFLAQMLETVDGIDICSPNEGKLALKSNFREDQISYTGTSLSESDIEFLAEHPGIHVNLDSLASLRRFASRCPGRILGVRVNPESGIGYRNEKRLVYSAQDRPGKFGLLREQVPDALAIAAKYGCRINTVHWHIGCGWLDEQLDELAKILEKGAAIAAQFPNLEQVNIGGGLGVPFRADDKLLSLDRWAEIVRKTIGGRWKICLEPGSFLVQDAGILLARVNTIETKRQWTFAGINAGFNLVMEPVFYGMRLEPVFLLRPGADRKILPVTIAGNINEAHDIFVADFEMPLPEEGELLAFLNAGAYAAAMSSNHCLRGDFLEFTVP